MDEYLKQYLENDGMRRLRKSRRLKKRFKVELRYLPGTIGGKLCGTDWKCLQHYTSRKRAEHAITQFSTQYLKEQIDYRLVEVLNEG